jgi:hypothetical protein
VIVSDKQIIEIKDINLTFVEAELWVCFHLNMI